MRYIFFLLLLNVNENAFTQVTFYDSCKVVPTDSVFFEGLRSGEEIPIEYIGKAGKLQALDKKCQIIGFTLSWDCESGDINERRIKGGTFSATDIKIISGIKSKSVLVLDCIFGIKNNRFIVFRPHYYYIK